jgi:predicted nucleic acid-binding protein
MVPPLWILEMANGFLSSARRGAISATFVERCCNDVEGLLSSAIVQGGSAISVRQAFSAANTFRLTAYDAAYLEVARAEHLPLATLDRALRDAATKARVSLFR